MNPTARSFAAHLIAAIGAGWLVLAAFIALDMAHLRTLLSTSPDAPLAFTLLAFFFTLTFGSVGLGAAAISEGRKRPGDEDDPSGGRRARRADARLSPWLDRPLLQPAPARGTPKGPRGHAPNGRER